MEENDKPLEVDDNFLDKLEKKIKNYRGITGYLYEIVRHYQENEIKKFPKRFQDELSFLDYFKEDNEKLDYLKIEVYDKLRHALDDIEDYVSPGCMEDIDDIFSYGNDESITLLDRIIITKRIELLFSRIPKPKRYTHNMP